MKYHDYLATEVSKIYQSLSDNQNPYLINHPSLLSGKSGVALFFLNYSEYTGNSEAKRLVETYLNDILQESQSLTDFTLGSGLLGVSWLLRQATKKKIETHGIDQGDIDEVCEAMIEKYFQKKNYDALYGLISIGNYYLSQGPLNDTAIKNINKIIDHLLSLSLNDKDGIYWNNYFSVVRDNKDQLAQDFGLAHGIPSIIIFLSRVHLAEIYPQDLSGKLSKASNWLLSRQGQYGFGKFPNKVIDGRVKGLNRIAWCYGDLSVGLALVSTSEINRDTALYNKAIHILEECAARSLEQSGVFWAHNDNYVDDGFCHGTAGNAYIFWKLWKKYQNPKFLAASEYWIEVSTKYRNERPLAGYFKLILEEEYPFCEGITGLLDGPAGIGLCYMAILTDNQQNDNWDFIFSL